MKLTSSQLRRIIAEEVKAARRRRDPEPPQPGSPEYEELQQRYAREAADAAARSEAQWMGYLSKYPKLLAKLDAAAFMEKLRARERGAQGGGWSIGKAEVVAEFLAALEAQS